MPRTRRWSRTRRRLRSGSKQHDRGFTLTESLVVLALFGAMVAYAYPAVRLMMAEAKLESMVQQTATLFYSARLRAIREATTSRVAFEDDDDGMRVWATIDRNRDGDFNSNIGNVQFDRTIEFGGPPSDSDAVDGFAGDRVEFRSDGTVADPGAVRIFGHVGDEIRYYEVRVEPAAAPRITVLEWDTDEEEWVEEGVE